MGIVIGVVKLAAMRLYEEQHGEEACRRYYEGRENRIFTTTIPDIIERTERRIEEDKKNRAQEAYRRTTQR